MAKELSVVLVGCGGMAGAWLDVAGNDPDLHVVGLTDLRREAAEQRAEDFELGPEVVYETLEEALEATSPDVVFDCTVPEAHHQVTMTALSAGCHVMGEKPLADSMEHAREMVAKAEEMGRIYAVMQNRRYLPTAPAAAKLARDGMLGDITTVNVDFYIGAHFSGFRTEMEHPLLLDMAIHTFDQARQLTGADPLSVYCKAFNPAGSWYADNASAMCVFEMTDDIVFNYRGSWCSEGYNTPWAGQWRIIGTRGTEKWAEDEPCAEIIGDADGFMSEMQDVTAEEVPLQAHGHEGCINEFLQCVREGGTPQTIASDNIKSLAMVFGAIESNAKDAPVQINL
jgi:predicted dehydrogenase